MSIIFHTLVLLMILIVLSVTLCTAGAEKVYYSGLAFDSEIVPSGMIPYEAGWSEGALFTSPTWILSQIDQNLTSSVLDRGITPVPTPTDTGTAEDYISAGFAALDAGNYRSAYSVFKQATIREPSSADAWYGLGLSLENQKRLLSALDAYATAITHSDNSADEWTFYAGKGRVCFALNRIEEAKKTLETAITRYENTGISYPDEFQEISRLLQEINEKSSPAYIK